MTPREVAASLTPVQKYYVTIGTASGDITMTTVRALKRKGIWALKITSPNGQCGHMEMTDLGRQVQAILKEKS